MPISKLLNKAEYFFNPPSLINRIKNHRLPDGDQEVTLPWKDQIIVSPKDVVGKAMYHLGVYELPLSEIIWRSLNHADCFLDIGANIGYFTSLANGKEHGPKEIISFEAHPYIFAKLEKNAGSWNRSKRIKLNHKAVTSESGRATLHVPKLFADNCGVSSLEKMEGAEAIEVETVTIDSIIGERKKVIIKIDIEGHEIEAFKGASESFKNEKIDAIFFEEHRPYPTDTFSFLEEKGFLVVRIDRGFWSPKINPVDSVPPEHSWEPLNYLAVRDPSFLESLQEVKGWSIFN